MIIISLTKKLKCDNQLRLNGCGSLSYWTANIFAYFVQYIIVPMLVFTVLFVIPHSDAFPDAFVPFGT